MSYFKILYFTKLETSKWNGWFSGQIAITKDTFKKSTRKLLQLIHAFTKVADTKWAQKKKISHTLIYKDKWLIKKSGKYFSQ
jgi:hypothetical protein